MQGTGEKTHTDRNVYTWTGLSLLVAGGFKLKAKTGAAGAGAGLKQLETWWTGIPEFKFPVHVKEGAAVFQANGLTKVAAFKATFP